MSRYANAARETVYRATQLGVDLEVRGPVLCARKKFTPGDVPAAEKSSSEVWSVIMTAVTVSTGSIWGTTLDGVGGAVGLDKGEMVLNRSGCSKRYLAALDKLLSDLRVHQFEQTKAVNKMIDRSPE